MDIKISADLTLATNALILNVLKKRPDAEHRAEFHVAALRDNARLAYLDGQVAWSKALRREAHRLERTLSRNQSLGLADALPQAPARSDRFARR